MKQFSTKYLYLYKFISECLPIYAFYNILFVERGLSIGQVTILIALWSVFAVLSEIPTGILADRWNRRNMLVIACILQGMCFMLWFYSHTFVMFMIGFALWGLASSFVSGTEEGLIYDNLKREGREEEFTTIYGRAQFWANVGVITAVITAGFLVTFLYLGYIALISAGLCVVAAILATRIRECNLYREQSMDEEPGVLDTLRGAGTFIKGNPIALLVIVFLVFFASIMGYLDEYDAFITKDFGLGHVWVSVIFTVRFASIAIGDLLVPIVQKKINNLRGIIFFTLGGNVLLLVFSVLWNQYVLLIFGLSVLILTVASILLINMLQEEIKEEGRATVMSFVGIGQNVFMIVLSLIYGFLAGFISLHIVYIVIAMYGILGCIVFVILRRVLSKKFTKKVRGSC